MQLCFQRSLNLRANIQSYAIEEQEMLLSTVQDTDSLELEGCVKIQRPHSVGMKCLVFFQNAA